MKTLQWLWVFASLGNNQITDLIKAASSDGRDLAPGTANRWLQKDREQWAICILKSKYRGVCQSHLYVPNLLPAGGAMSLTKRYRVDIIRPVLLSNIWILVQIEHGMFELV